MNFVQFVCLDFLLTKITLELCQPGHINLSLWGLILAVLAALHFSFPLFLPPAISHFKAPYFLQNLLECGARHRGVKKTLMPVHLGIFSNEQGPTKEATGRGTCSLHRLERPMGCGGSDLSPETWFHLLHLVTNHLASLALLTMCWSPLKADVLGCGWCAGPISSMCSLWVGHYKMYRISEAEIWTLGSHKPKDRSSGLSFPSFPIL